MTGQSIKHLAQLTPPPITAMDPHISPTQAEALRAYLRGAVDATGIALIIPQGEEEWRTITEVVYYQATHQRELYPAHWTDADYQPLPRSIGEYIKHLAYNRTHYQLKELLSNKYTCKFAYIVQDWDDYAVHYFDALRMHSDET